MRESLQDHPQITLVIELASRLLFPNAGQGESTSVTTTNELARLVKLLQRGTGNRKNDSQRVEAHLKAFQVKTPLLNEHLWERLANHQGLPRAFLKLQHRQRVKKADFVRWVRSIDNASSDFEVEEVWKKLDTERRGSIGLS